MNEPKKLKEFIVEMNKNIIMKYLGLIFLVLFLSCQNPKKSNPETNKNKTSSGQLSLPKNFYKHLTGTYFNMPATISFTALDTFAYLTITYGQNYNTITATIQNFKKGKFSYALLQNLKTHDTVETWKGKFTSDSTLELFVSIPIRDTVYKFVEDYSQSLPLQVSRFDTTLYYDTTRKELFIYKSNSLYSDRLSFSFLNDPKQLRKIYDTIYPYFVKYFPSYNPNSEDYFYPLFWNRLMTVEYNEHNLLVISDNYYEFFGGAHGLNWIKYYNIDVNQNRLLTITDIFKDTTSLPDMIYKKLSSKNIVLFVTKYSTHISKNFYIRGSQITFVYNPYEVAPYTAGIVEVSFKFKEIKPYLRQQFLDKYFPGIKL